MNKCCSFSQRSWEKKISICRESRHARIMSRLSLEVTRDRTQNKRKELINFWGKKQTTNVNAWKD